MKYNIKAIPTTYAGVNFRSRLEARWAAFFDLCGWDWDYEPFDLEGWAPDFMLKGEVKALVEVKPIDFGASETHNALRAKSDAGKAFRVAEKCRLERAHLGNFEHEILVVGNGPFASAGWASNWSLGVFALELWDVNDATTADLYFGDRSVLDYADRYGSYQYRFSGTHDGDHHFKVIGDDTPKHLWREAGNIVQWQAEVPRTSDITFVRA